MDKDECYRKQREMKSAGLPKDISLPFLAYGFYKPNQLAYSTIKGYVFNKPKHITINYELNHINGMPVLENKINPNSKVDAYMMEFKYAKQETAYKRIGYGKNKHVYKWEVINLSGQEVNVLMNAGDKSYPIYTDKWENYDWRDDPIFKYTISYLDKNIDKLKEKLDGKFEDGPYLVDFETFIEVQSAYMVLWTALDRFLTFRYGDTKTWNVKKLSEEHFFKKSLTKNYNALSKQEFYNDSLLNTAWEKTVFSAEDLEEYELTPNKPTCSALYYYTLRNNVVHAGKMMPEELNIILNALLGLTEIFKDVLKEVTKQ